MIWLCALKKTGVLLQKVLLFMYIALYMALTYYYNTKKYYLDYTLVFHLLSYHFFVKFH